MLARSAAASSAPPVRAEAVGRSASRCAFIRWHLLSRETEARARGRRADNNRSWLSKCQPTHRQQRPDLLPTLFIADGPCGVSLACRAPVCIRRPVLQHRCTKGARQFFAIGRYMQLGAEALSSIRTNRAHKVNKSREMPLYQYASLCFELCPVLFLHCSVRTSLLPGAQPTVASLPCRRVLGTGLSATLPPRR